MVQTVVSCHTEAAAVREARQRRRQWWTWRDLLRPPTPVVATTIVQFLLFLFFIFLIFSFLVFYYIIIKYKVILSFNKNSYGILDIA